MPPTMIFGNRRRDSHAHLQLIIKCSQLQLPLEANFFMQSRCRFGMHDDCKAQNNQRYPWCRSRNMCRASTSILRQSPMAARATQAENEWQLSYPSRVVRPKLLYFAKGFEEIWRSGRQARLHQNLTWAISGEFSSTQRVQNVGAHVSG